MTPEQRIAEIKERLAKATPGPWTRVERSNYGREPHAGSIASGALSVANLIAKIEDDGQNVEADADLLAHSPDDIAFLLGQLDAAREDSRRLDWLDANGLQHARLKQTSNTLLFRGIDDIRPAIDAAMSGSVSSETGGQP